MIGKGWAAAVVMLVALAGCGGGGGNPGTCSGSDEVCGRIPAASATDTTVVLVPESQLEKITCLQILVLNNGDKAAAFAAAQDARRRGRLDLDGDKDGLACNGVF